MSGHAGPPGSASTAPASVPSGEAAEVLAALDLGTNNCRLLIAVPDDQGFRVIDAFSRIVRLGEGLAHNGSLAPAAIDRTLVALKICAGKLRRRRVTRLRAVATEACRRAGNGTAFRTRVLEETGIALDIINEAEEAELAIRGCAALLNGGGCEGLVFDIGGGSTEVVWMECSGETPAARSRSYAPPRVKALHSIPLGVVTLAERYGGHEVTDGAYRAMVAETSRALAPFEAIHKLATRIAGGEVQILGTSGTVTTLAGIHLGLPRYRRDRVDGCLLEGHTIQILNRRIAAMTFAERARHPCIGRKRADLVIAGCAILEGLCSVWPMPRLRVADRGLREGILWSLLQDVWAPAVAVEAPVVA
ncbi:MAG: Ppx/GppA family phosphatase [Kiloniellales bacterium]